MNTVVFEEEEFRGVVLDLHKAGHFKGDPHKMQTNFKKHKNSVRFVSIGYEVDGQIVAFCGMDVFEVGPKKIVKGMIHCQGVIQSHRQKGLSKQILKEIEDHIGDEVVEILSICNPISCKSHQSVGYLITNPGRLSPSGKLMQIRLTKTLSK